MPVGTWEARQRKSRAQQAQREAAARGIQQHQLVNLNAKWEQQTSKRIRAATVQQRTADRARRDKADLLRRRRKLAALLSDDHKMLNNELVNSFETMEERRAKMVLRAQELQRLREQQRLAEVKRLREMQWRDSVDEIRTYRTEIVTLGIAKDRLEQLKEKEDKDRKAKELEDTYARQWKELGEIKYQRELREQQEVSSRNAATRASLAAQLKERKAIIAEEKAEDAADLRKMQAHWDAQNKAEAGKIEKERLDAIEREFAVAKFNDHKKALDMRKGDAEEALDQFLLKQALAKEAAERQKEQDLRDSLKAEMRNYQEFLKEQMIKETVDTSYMEELMKRERDKEFKKREDRWDAEAEARRQLMIEVDKSRKIQMANKKVRAIEEAKYDEKMSAQVAREAAKAHKREDDKVVKAAAARIANRDAILAQIAAKEKRQSEAAIFESKYEKLDAEADAEYQERLDRLYKEDHKKQMDFRRKKVQWYY